MLVNAVYLRALGLEGLAATQTPASEAAAGLFGALGRPVRHRRDRDLDLRLPRPRDPRADARLLRDGGRRRLLPGARTAASALPDALARDRHSVHLVLHPRARRATYEQLLNYVVFADWIFFGLTVGTVMVFRRTLPAGVQPGGLLSRAGYPVVQILFVLISAAVVLSVVRDDPTSALRGALLLALGIPVFFWYRRRTARTQSHVAQHVARSTSDSTSHIALRTNILWF